MPVIGWYQPGPDKPIDFEVIEPTNEVTVNDLEKVQSFREISEAGGLDHSKFLESYFGYVLGENVSNVEFSGSLDSGFFAEQFAIKSRQEGFVVDEDRIFDSGIVLSTGDYPIRSGTLDGRPVLIGNSSEEYSIVHGTAGDSDLDSVINGAFDEAGSTQDASVIEFDFDLDDPSIDTLRASLVFGSEEFPEYSDTSFVDVAAFFVNGVNNAVINSTGKPLSVLSENVDSGVFVENSRVPGAQPSSSVISGEYGIEWNGFTKEISIRAPVEQGVNSIKIAIADTGDAGFDSGIFIGDMSLSSEGASGTGVLSVVKPDDTGAAAASVAAEEFVLGTGASESISGTPGNLDGDVITGFDSSDSVTVLDTLFGAFDVTFSSGSVIMDIDTDADGAPDTNLTFAGKDDPESFVFSQEDGSTIIGLEDDPVVNEDPTLTGNVTDAAGNPLTGLNLAFNGETATTDGSGAFTVSQGGDASGTLTASDGSPSSTTDASDGAAIMRMAMGLSDPDEFELIAADVNQDGAVTAADAQAVYKTASGLASDGQVGEYILLDADADYSGANLADTGYSGGVDIPALTDDLDVSLIALQLGDTDQFNFV